jgi:glycosyltransferase involved in cell wall biosynthesis
MERSLRHVDALLAPSHFTAERHRAAGIECPIRVLPHFATIDAPAQTWSSPPAGERANFLYAGRLTASKGVLELVHLFLNLPQYDLLLAGDGELSGTLRHCIGQAKHIRLLGSVEHANLISRYQEATAVIVPSIGPEAFGLVAVEAMACGTPVIVREAGGSAETIQTSGGGVVYRSDDELLYAVHRLAADPAWRGELARKARVGYEENYTAATHLNKYLQIIETIRAQKHSTDPAPALA